MNSSNSNINKIKSSFSLKNIASFLISNRILNIFKYNKNLRKKLEIQQISYDKYLYLKKVYKKIKKEQKLKCYYNYKDYSILFLLNKIKNKETKTEIIKEFFIDIYEQYSKEIEVFIDTSKINYSQFKDFISIEAPFKLILKYDPSNLNPIIEKKVIKMMEKKNIIKGFKLYIDQTKSTFFGCNFLNKLKEFENLEYLRIDPEIFDDVDLSKNTFKSLKIIPFNLNRYIDFFKYKKKYINNDVEELIIEFPDEYDFTRERGKKLKLINYENLRTLKLKSLPNACVIDKITLESINNLHILHTDIIYKNISVNFKNLKSFFMCGVSFSKIFEFTEDFSFFSNLEVLGIEAKPCKLFYKILKNSNNIKELHLLYSSYFNAEDSDFEEEIEEEEDEEEHLKIIKKEDTVKILEILINYKKLKYINLNHVGNDFLFTFLKSYKSENLKKFKCDNIKNLNNDNINIFLENNPNINMVDLSFERENYLNSFEVNKNSKIKKIILCDFSKGTFFINPFQLKIIKLYNCLIHKDLVNIFLKNQFDNLIEFYLENRFHLIDDDDDSLIKLLLNFNNFKELKILTLIGNFVDDNFVETFMANYQSNLNTLFFGRQRSMNWEQRVNLDYYYDLYPNIKSIDDINIFIGKNQ